MGYLKTDMHPVAQDTVATSHSQLNHIMMEIGKLNERKATLHEDIGALHAEVQEVRAQVLLLFFFLFWLVFLFLFFFSFLLLFIFISESMRFRNA